MPSTKLQARSQTAQILRAAAPANAAQLEHIKGGAPAEAAASPLKLMLLIVGWYVGNTAYNVYNKKACAMIHAHWTVAFVQLVVGAVWSLCLWAPGIRKTPILSKADIKSLAPIGLFAAAAHGGSVLAMGAGAVSFAQIVKAAEPVYVALLCLFIRPIEIKSFLSYSMLMMIVGGVGLACVKEGKGVDINMAAFGWASFANLAAALKGKLGKDVSHALKAQVATNNMTVANTYAVMNILSATWTLFVVLMTEASTISKEWDHATKKHAGGDIIKNVALSGFFFYLYNELAFLFLAEVGPVTSSVMNTAKRVIVIIACAIIFGEKMDRNAKLGATIAVSGVFLYSLAEEADKKAKAAAKAAASK
jgi:solute carrier family 35 protein E1